VVLLGVLALEAQARRRLLDEWRAHLDLPLRRLEPVARAPLEEL
jgi:hypothetical protein